MMDEETTPDDEIIYASFRPLTMVPISDLEEMRTYTRMAYEYSTSLKLLIHEKKDKQSLMTELTLIRNSLYALDMAINAKLALHKEVE